MNAKKKLCFLPIILGLSGLLALTGCGSPAAEPTRAESHMPAQKVNKEFAERLPKTISQRGSLIVHTTSDYAPLNFASETGESTGFSIDLGNAIGELLGVKVDWQVSTFDSLIPGLQAGRYDISMASYGVTNKRKEIVDFVQVINGASALAIRTDSDSTIPDTMSLCGMQMGVVTGTFYVDVAEQMSSDCTDKGKQKIVVSGFPSMNDALGALRSSRIDTFFNASGALLFASAQQPNQFKVVGEDLWPDLQGPEAVVLPKGSDLTPIISKAVNELISNGTYQAIVDKWNLKSMGVEEAKINPAVNY
jgi:polar amino acid transport system substrate-binding protein